MKRDAAFERRFQPVNVEAPTIAETIDILRGVHEQYETHHRVTFTDQALVAAANLSDRYISDRSLPDKAIDLIDEAGSRLRMKQTSEDTQPSIVDEDIIAEVLANWTGIPVQRLNIEEMAKLLSMEDELHKRVVGQEDAINALFTRDATYTRWTQGSEASLWVVHLPRTNGRGQDRTCQDSG